MTDEIENTSESESARAAQAIFVFNSESRLIQYTYEEPFMDGLVEMLDNNGTSYVIDDIRPDISSIYVDEGGVIRDLGIIHSRFSKEQITADGIDSTTITDLPEGTNIFVDSVLIATGTSFTLATSDEGIYLIELSCNLHVPVILSIRAI